MPSSLYEQWSKDVVNPLQVQQSILCILLLLFENGPQSLPLLNVLNQIMQVIILLVHEK
jgi:hypothetical protein